MWNIFLQWYSGTLIQSYLLGEEVGQIFSLIEEDVAVAVIFLLRGFLDRGLVVVVEPLAGARVFCKGSVVSCGCTCKTTSLIFLFSR